MYKAGCFEKEAWDQDSLVCGIDEAGRGCLFGPLTVAAVILPKNTKNVLLKDSKIMTEQQRNIAYDWITKNCFFSCIIVDAAAIDRKNVHQATRSAMQKAFIQIMDIVPFSISKITHLVTDALPITIPSCYNHEKLSLYNPTHSESISPSVAAASIIAKVTRDRLMEKYAILFPCYFLEQHKGYCTKLHTDIIKQFGTSIIHRKTFLSQFTKPTKMDSNGHKQQSIC